LARRAREREREDTERDKRERQRQQELSQPYEDRDSDEDLMDVTVINAATKGGAADVGAKGGAERKLDFAQGRQVPHDDDNSQDVFGGISPIVFNNHETASPFATSLPTGGSSAPSSPDRRASSWDKIVQELQHGRWLDKDSVVQNVRKLTLSAGLPMSLKRSEVAKSGANAGHPIRISFLCALAKKHCKAKLHFSCVLIPGKKAEYHWHLSSTRSVIDDHNHEPEEVRMGQVDTHDGDGDSDSNHVQEATRPIDASKPAEFVSLIKDLHEGGLCRRKPAENDDEVATLITSAIVCSMILHYFFFPFRLI